MEFIALFVELMVVLITSLLGGIWFLLEWALMVLLCPLIGVLWFLGFLLQLVWIGVSEVGLAFLEWITWLKA